MGSIEIPEYCGAILLKDITLFPQGALPLHIFEQRYQIMLEDALKGNCMFCIGTLEKDETSDPATCVARTGTVGLIRASREQTDGHSNLLLHGVIRVNFDQWLTSKPYPYAHITPLASDPLPADKREAIVNDLCSTINRVLTPFPEKIRSNVTSVVEKSRQSPDLLADAISQQFIQDPSDRKMLLEELDLRKRYDFLTAFLEQATRESDNN